VSDLAVIKVNPIPGMISARLGDSDKIEVGQRAIAIGNPFGLQHTVTAGFVSAIQRDITIGQRTMTGMFQTDAAINPGNSGGPLINSNSEVFAINTAIFSQTGSFIGIGLAVPINRAKKVAQQLITHGRAIYPWLGIQSHLDVDDRYADRLGLPRIKGVLVCAVAQDSPAARAGLRGGNHYAKFDGKTVVYQNRPVVIGGDFIVEVDGTPTATFDDCENLIMNKNVGDPVLVKFIRDNKAYQVSLTLAADPRVSRQP
jgi:S1-C subfamily serine protease